jgi:CO/xanthine dehydrogenase FAD-binding subunit
MKGDAKTLDLIRPRDLDHALALLAEAPGALRPFAGGTDLMVLFSAGRLSGGRFLDLWSLAPLRGIRTTETTLIAGSLTTYTDVERHPIFQAEFPMLCQAARETGGWAIQNRGTLGGNVANASPAADSPPALLAYDASIELASARGRRIVPYATFHTGYKATVMAKDELIVALHLPRTRQGRVDGYRKVGPRKAQAISKVCLAACVDHDGPRVAAVRLAFGGVAPTVIRCTKTEAWAQRALPSNVTLDEGLALLRTEISPIDDVRSTANYRRRVAENMAATFFQRAREALRATQG